MPEKPQAPVYVGRYQLINRIAVGGMAEIVLAQEQGIGGLERFVVIKRILPQLVVDPSFVDMFLREARIVARLNHPNIVQIYELNEEAGNYFIAMEYIRGCTLRDLQRLAKEQERKIPQGVAVSIVIEACRGAHAAHQLRDAKGQFIELVHRDISPQNLMIGTEGHVKLLDFGVAKATAPGQEATYSGSIKGKFAYMSPEQCRNKPLDRRSDVFALGILLWELCTGRSLFKRPSELEMMKVVCKAEVLPPSLFAPDLPVSVESIILKALSLNREDRFPSAESMRRALQEASRESRLEIGSDLLEAFTEDVAGRFIEEQHLNLLADYESYPENFSEIEIVEPSYFAFSSASKENNNNLFQPTISGRGALVSSILESSSEMVFEENSSSLDIPIWLEKEERIIPSPTRERNFPVKMPGKVIVQSEDLETRSDRVRPVSMFSSIEPPTPTQEESEPTRELVPLPSFNEVKTLRDERLQSLNNINTLPLPREDTFPALTENAKQQTHPNRKFTWLAIAAILALTTALVLLLVLKAGGPLPPPPVGPQSGQEKPSAPTNLPASACAGALPDVELSGVPIRIGWAPVYDRDMLLQESDPLRRFLELKLRRPVKFIVSKDYEDLSSKLIRGAFDFAVLPPLLFLHTLAKDPKSRPVLIREFDGSISNSSYLIVRTNDKINMLSELEGKRFCFTDPESTSGYFIPRLYITNKGYDPDEFVSQIHWSGDHFQVLRDLIDGKCDAAGVFSGAWQTAGSKKDIAIGKLKLLDVAGRTPQDTLTASSFVSEEDIKNVHDALLGFDPNDVVCEATLGLSLRLTGFQEPKPELFVDIERAQVMSWSKSAGQIFIEGAFSGGIVGGH